MDHNYKEPEAIILACPDKTSESKGPGRITMGPEWVLILPVSLPLVKAMFNSFSPSERPTYFAPGTLSFLSPTTLEDKPFQVSLYTTAPPPVYNFNQEYRSEEFPSAI